MLINSSSPMNISLCVPNVFIIPPPINSPIIIPNIAQGCMATGVSLTVLFNSFPGHNIATTVPLTMGDFPGIAMGGGVKSGTAFSTCKHIKSSAKIFIENKPVTRFSDTTSQNNMNGVGSTISPSQSKVFAFT